MTKAILFWSLFILFILIGITSTSLIIYSVFNDGNQIKLLLKSLPYLWILITIGFFIISYFNIKNTENSYKYLTIKNIIITFVSSIIIGIFFYNLGFAKLLDIELQNSVPVYKNYITEHMQAVWNNPEEGLLIGKIKEIKSNSEIILEDYGNREWNILINKSTVIKGKVNINIDSGIKIIGKKINNNTFEAQEIRPEVGMMMQNGGMMKNINQ